MSPARYVWCPSQKFKRASRNAFLQGHPCHCVGKLHRDQADKGGDAAGSGISHAMRMRSEGILFAALDEALEEALGVSSHRRGYTNRSPAVPGETPRAPPSMQRGCNTTLSLLPYFFWNHSISIPSHQRTTLCVSASSIKTPCVVRLPTRPLRVAYYSLDHVQIDCMTYRLQQCNNL